MAADVPQEGYIFERVEPIGVVDHDSIGRAITEGEETIEDAPDRGDVGGNSGIVEQLPAFVLAGRVAYLGGAAAHHHDRFMAGLLEPPQHHDLDKAADVQRWSGCVKADIARHDPVDRKIIEAAWVCDLMDIAALRKGAEEIGFIVGHRRGRLAWDTPPTNSRAALRCAACDRMASAHN